MVSTEGNNQSAPGTCPDKAGNSASTTFNHIDIDKTAPVITAHAAVGNDPYISDSWTNQDVKVNFTCSDTLSCVQTFSDPSTFSAEEANQSATPSYADKAGNSASTSFSPIKI